MSGTHTTPPGAGSGATPAGCAKAPCPIHVSVVINPSQPVACPGHPLSITAVGTPAGGTFKWTVSKAHLVDAAGKPVSTGDTVFLRGFKANDADGSIPEQASVVSVKYTHPNGTATASKPVPIHKIDFDITDTAIAAGLTQANEAALGVSLGAAPGVPTMSTDPKVKIKLDASCPRKAACAANHRVGWLQTVLTNVRHVRYRDSLQTVTVPLPIRDGIAGPTPFYQWVNNFTGDGDQETAHHEDSPAHGAPWLDPRAGAPMPPPPVNGQLRKIQFADSFTAWLVVQNVEWSLHDLPGSLAYQRHFDWSMHLTVKVDTTLPVGSRCTPASSPPTIAAMSPGKGSTPNLKTPIANNSVTVKIARASPPV